MARLRSNTGSSRLQRNQSAIANVLRSAHIEESQRCNPEIARQHAAAVAAANLAYQPNPPAPVYPDGKVTTDIPRALRKTQSVRFQGPNANQTPQRSITRRIAPNWDHVRRKKEQNSRQSSPVHTLTALPRYDGAEMPPKSSYKRVKKARSMFSPRKHFTDYRTHATPVQEHFREYSQPSGSIEIARSSLERELFSTEQVLLQLPNPYQTTYDQDAAIRMAQNEYRRQIEEQSTQATRPSTRPTLQSQPSNASTTYSPSRQNSQKVLPKTKRSVSGNQYGASVGSQPVNDTLKSKDKGFGHTARKISSSLRSRFKKAFGRKSNKSLPDQQVDAQRLHFNDFSAEFPSETPQDDATIPMPNEELISRMSSRESFQTQNYMKPEQPRDSSSIRNTSAEYDENEDGSRVTSWANSVTTTATFPSVTTKTKDRKRLTVIDEHGDAYQPSSSVNVGQSTSRSRYNAFRKPPKGRINEPVDSQAMYNALQEKLEPVSKMKRDKRSTSSLASSRKSFMLRRKGSSASNATNKTTVRMVLCGSSGTETPRTPSDGSNMNPQVCSYTENDDVFRPDASREMNDPRSCSDHNQRSGSLESSFAIEQPQTKGNKQLRETRSSFFPRSQDQKPKTPSPYKKLLRTQKNKVAKKSRPSSNLRLIVPSAAGSDDSGSVYSRRITGTPLGIEPLLYPSESHNDLGTAVVEDSQRIARRYSDLIGDSPEKERIKSTSSFSEWRTWMASQVEGLARSPKEGSSLDNFALPEPVRGYDGAGTQSYDAMEESDGSSEDAAVYQTRQKQRPSNVRQESHDFDYGFATSNVLHELASRGPSAQVQYTVHEERSRDKSIDMSLTERKHSQSNLVQRQVTNHRESLPSYRKHSTENGRRPSQQVLQPPPLNTKKSNKRDESRELRTESSFKHLPTISKKTREEQPIIPPRSHYIKETKNGSMTVVVRRRDPEREARLRRFQSSKSLKEDSQERRQGTRRPGVPGQYYGGRDGRASEVIDSPYGTSGSGMLGPSAGAGSSSRMVNQFLNKSEGSRERAPAFL